MKKLKYHLCVKVNHGTADCPLWEDILYAVEMEWNEVNEQIAKKEAYNGEYTVEDDGQEHSQPLTITERVSALEKLIQPAAYTPGTWYYRGDLVFFENAVHTCIAPKDTVCVWSPAEYPAYWQRIE